MLPAPLLNRPELRLDLQPAWDAFWALSHSRPLGFGCVGPISLSEVLTYFGWKEVTDADEQDELLSFIRGMDSEYLKVVNKPPEKK